MNITDENRALWLELYKTAEIFRNMKPWEWLEEDDIFGVQDPTTGEKVYCCVIGGIGQVLGMAVYLGAEGYNSLIDLFDEEEDIFHMAGFHQKCLLISFTDRDNTTERDRQQLKALGISYRGKKQWVQFRDQMPGYLPWYITDEQALLLINVLKQSIGVAIRAEEDTTFINEKLEDSLLLLRKAKKSGDEWLWYDEYEEEPEYEEKPFIVPDKGAIEKISQHLPVMEGAILFNTFFLPGGIREKADERPVYGRIGQWITYPDGLILSFQVFDNVDFETKFLLWFLDSLENQLKFIPKQIVVPNQYNERLIAGLCEELGIELIFSPDEPIFEEIYDSIQGMMG